MKSKGKIQLNRRYAPKTTEWPTVFILAVTWLSFAVLTRYYHQLPLWLVIPLGAYLLALFSSLQHEVLHHHPTCWQWLNEAMIFPAITLWIPFSLYKTTHLRHHNNANLTDPERDPESFYIRPESWDRFPGWLKHYFRFYNTLTGRFFWGPVHVVLLLLYNELNLLIRGNSAVVRRWLVHGVACAPVLYWVMAVCNIPFWEYVLFFVYPGLAVTLVRSFLEHRVADNPKHRSVIVEACPVLSLAFLNNNLHAIHHDHPGLAWYRLPEIWRQNREQILQRNDQYYFSGYREVIKRYWRRAKEEPCYPKPLVMAGAPAERRYNP